MSNPTAKLKHDNRLFDVALDGAAMARGDRYVPITVTYTGITVLRAFFMTRNPEELTVLALTCAGRIDAPLATPAEAEDWLLGFAWEGMPSPLAPRGTEGGRAVERTARELYRQTKVSARESHMHVARVGVATGQLSLAAA